ncbi:solute carrier family 35 member C2 isoform X3 [Vidua chalybeata]|uniref:solute carrier family 35 member C2 isoform X3 n=1 Tax=Vidua chalybeata TaxID=81927 RepID=UPI0023A86769|nr:solute carrier family 35 member C2 isoform X3 [Vidua chalybeata]
MAAGPCGAALGRAALAAPLVLLYYGFSIGITFYNKWLMKSFPFPLLVTLLHLLLIFALAALARALARCRSGRPRAALSWADCLRRAAPAALSTSLDIGLSNWSFLYVTVSLYTMTKSSAILFILLFSLLFKLEEMRVTLLLVVLLIAGGLFMFTYKSTQFNAQGFVLVLCASFLGGIRWTLTQILMQKAELGLQNPIDIMFHLQPLMFLGLFPLFAVFEGLPLSISEKLFRFHEAGMLFSLEICILFLATHLLGDRLSLLNWLGFAVCLLGISLHVVLKAMNSKGDKALEPHKEASSDPDLQLLLRHPEHAPWETFIEEQMLGFLLKFQYCKHPEGREKASLQTPLHSSGPLPSKQGAPLSPGMKLFFRFLLVP